MPIPTTTNIFELGRKFVRSAPLSIVKAFVAVSAGILPFLPGFFQFFSVIFSELIKGLIQLGHQIISGFQVGNGVLVSGIGLGIQGAANGLAMGIIGLWTGLTLYDVGTEMKEASVAIFQVSTLHNIASVVTWAIILMCAPSVAKGVTDLLSKTLPKMFMKLGGDG
jgi:hypothetical protein